MNEQIRQLREAASALAQHFGPVPASRAERLIQAVYANLAIERPELRIEQVRLVFGADRAG